MRLGIYVQVPFCQTKCTYCNFASGVQSKKTEQQYAGALLTEISAHSWKWTPETLYLGGGNAAHLDLDLPKEVRIASNDTGITGGIRLWDDRVWEAIPEVKPAPRT